jgi:hypothetical protein
MYCWKRLTVCTLAAACFGFLWCPPARAAPIVIRTTDLPFSKSIDEPEADNDPEPVLQITISDLKWTTDQDVVLATFENVTACKNDVEGGFPYSLHCSDLIRLANDADNKANIYFASDPIDLLSVPGPFSLANRGFFSEGSQVVINKDGLRLTLASDFEGGGGPSDSIKIEAIPEPTSIAILAAGLFASSVLRRRRRT